MADLSLVFTTPHAKIDVLTLDASLSETHQTQIEVTDHPVEQGVDISDHKRRKPDQVTIEGLVTNDQSGGPAVAYSARGNANPVTGQSVALSYTSQSKFVAERYGNAYHTLLGLADSKQLITIVTALRTYQNMVMTDLSVPRDAASGQALRFTATFREIRVVQNQTIQIQAKTTRANKVQDLSKKVPPTATAAQSKPRSALKSFSNGSIGDNVVQAVKKMSPFGGG